VDYVALGKLVAVRAKAEPVVEPVAQDPPAA